jgi:hypothetical protein
MCISLRLPFVFFVLDSLGLHAGLGRREIVWMPRLGWVWGSSESPIRLRLQPDPSIGAAVMSFEVGKPAFRSFGLSRKFRAVPQEQTLDHQSIQLHEQHEIGPRFARQS